jgi:hypothetical protein
MNGESHLIRQFYPAPRQVADVRVCRSGFIQVVIRRGRWKVVPSQGLTASATAVLSRKCGIRRRGMTSTLRYVS